MRFLSNTMAAEFVPFLLILQRKPEGATAHYTKLNITLFQSYELCSDQCRDDQLAFQPVSSAALYPVTLVPQTCSKDTGGNNLPIPWNTMQDVNSDRHRLEEM